MLLLPDVLSYRTRLSVLQLLATSRKGPGRRGFANQCPLDFGVPLYKKGKNINYRSITATSCAVYHKRKKDIW